MLAGIFFFCPQSSEGPAILWLFFFVQPKTSLKELNTLGSLSSGSYTRATEAAACFKLHSRLPEEGRLETLVKPVYSSMICGRVL